MKAVILAGGKGTRLGELTADIPKPMIPVAGKPLLQYQIELLARYGITEAILLVNHLKQPIIDHFGQGEFAGVNISYFEESFPMGTVGGVKELEDQLTGDFIVLYGDVMMDMDLSRLLEFHRERDSEATLVVHPNDHPYDSDLLELGEDDRVTEFFPKPHATGRYYSNMVNAAVYVFSPAIFKYLEKGKKADFGKDIFPKVHSQMRMFGYNTTEYLKDMGTPDRLERVTADVVSGKVERSNLGMPQKAIFLDRDGVINEDLHLIHKPEELHLYPFAADAIKRINRSEYLAVVATNQSVVARNLTDLEGLREIHRKMETELGEERAKLDAIYFCPHHPDKGFPEENPAFKLACECRKPKPGMLKQAAERFHIELHDSWMLGDSERDIQAGMAAGCRTVGVATGNGLRDSATQPDFFFANLQEAIDYILDDPFAAVSREVSNRIPALSSQFVIGIGGNSRSGKSTLASQLQWELTEQGMKVFRINLDDWILQSEDRKAEDDVYERFRLKQLISDIARILKGEVLEFSGYRRHSKMPERNVRYAYQGEEIVLLEGVVALSDERLREFIDLNIFFESEKEQIHKRLHTYYEWKGRASDQIDALFEQRWADEYQLIEKDAAYADILINSVYDHH